MNDKLQELTQRIYNEGLEKGKKEAEQLVAQAKQEADEILKLAHKEAEKLRSEAKKEADELSKNVNSELSLSAKQAISAIKQQITEVLVTKAVDQSIEKAFDDKDFVKSIISQILTNWGKADATNKEVILSLPGKDRKLLEDHFLSKVAKEIKTGFELNFEEGIRSGFTIGPKDGSYKISFTEQDFGNFFKQYLRPRTTKLLYGDK
jgi:V/A-type H+/Na+-transporting ATPase subunit E